MTPLAPGYRAWACAQQSPQSRFADVTSQTAVADVFGDMSLETTTRSAMPVSDSLAAAERRPNRFELRGKIEPVMAKIGVGTGVAVASAALLAHYHLLGVAAYFAGMIGFGMMFSRWERLFRRWTGRLKGAAVSSRASDQKISLRPLSYEDGPTTVDLPGAAGHGNALTTSAAPREMKSPASAADPRHLPVVASVYRLTSGCSCGRTRRARGETDSTLRRRWRAILRDGSALPARSLLQIQKHRGAAPTWTL